MTRRATLGGAFLASVTATCAPALGPDDSLVASTRILAIRADPAEADPGTRVAFTSLVASPLGTVAGAIAWSFCLAPKPVTDDNIVSDACLGSSAALSAGAGPTTTATTPSQGCSLFGPNTPSANARPRDPDPTGGYYQPLRAELRGSDSAFALVRIQCDLADASAATAAAFTASYHPNQNPTLLPLTASLDAKPVTQGAVPSGARIVIQATWPSTSAETFPYYDPASGTLTMQRESMQVAWYASGGHLDTESTGRGANDPATNSENGWVAPIEAGTVHLWVVLRDSRGGVDFGQSDLVVSR